MTKLPQSLWANKGVQHSSKQPVQKRRTTHSPLPAAGRQYEGRSLRRNKDAHSASAAPVEGGGHLSHDMALRVECDEACRQLAAVAVEIPRLCQVPIMERHVTDSLWM